MKKIIILTVILLALFSGHELRAQDFGVDSLTVSEKTKIERDDINPDATRATKK